MLIWTYLMALTFVYTFIKAYKSFIDMLVLFTI